MTEKGNGHEHGNGHPYRALLDDEALAKQFEALVSAAQAKGYSEDEIGYGLLWGTVDSMLASGEPDCCVMQLLLDFTSSYFEYWHDRMGDEGKSGDNGSEAEAP